MKRRLLSALLALLLLWPACSLAGGRQYIIPDSNTRELTAEELWEWDYESIGFIFNEIFARHGYNFIPGGRYYNYFISQPWYTPNADSDNSRACYSQLNRVEWANEHLCKEVRADMRSLGTKNREGKNYLDYVTADSFDVLSGFTYTNVKSGQKWPVYSAPSVNSWRGANSKASVSTNGAVYIAGWENGWLLLIYATNNGAVRVGYVDGSNVKGNISAPRLDFEYSPVTCVANASLTDDPATSFTTIRTIKAGETVTYLTSYQNRYDWAYVETTADGRTVRGFLPLESLDLGASIEENEDVVYEGAVYEGVTDENVVDEKLF